MANLYKKPVVVTDPATGRKIKTKSKKWWGQYKDASGRLRRHPLSIDKQAAQAMLNEIVRRVEREKAGLVDPTDEQRKRPLNEHGQYLHCASLVFRVVRRIDLGLIAGMARTT